MKSVLNNPIETVIFDRKILAKLKEIGAFTVKDVCEYSRMELTQNGIDNRLVNDIIIAMQLNGVDLKPNHAKKNNIIEERIKC